LQNDAHLPEKIYSKRVQLGRNVCYLWVTSRNN